MQEISVTTHRYDTNHVSLQKFTCKTINRSLTPREKKKINLAITDDDDDHDNLITSQHVTPLPDALLWNNSIENLSNVPVANNHAPSTLKEKDKKGLIVINVSQLEPQNDHEITREFGHDYSVYTKTNHCFLQRF